MKQPAAIYDQQVYYRIIALWVLCEAMLGGIIHALHIPVSGLIVGSTAVVCICLIAYYAPVKGAIIKATIIVAVFKMMLSPQAPVLAYAAVFFQGALGEVLFWNKRSYRFSCFLLGFLALLESGFQRIIVLTVVYGNNFWKAINDFINDLTKQKNFTDYSLYFISGYVLLHVIAGLIVGWWAGVIPQKILNWQIQFAGYEIKEETKTPAILPSAKKRRKLKTGLLVIWISLILLYSQSYFQIGDPILPPSIALQILIRSFIIVLSWYFLIGPISRLLLQTWLKKKQTGHQNEVEKIASLLPSTRKLVVECWKLSSGKKGVNKIIFFSKLFLAKILIAEIPLKRIFILTGDIQSGKTTSLLKWSENRNDVHGILTPVINSKRIFLEVETKEQFPMEALEDEKETISVGRFIFSQRSFANAKNIISNSIQKNGWLVIDEIGLLELKGEGFHDVLIRALQENSSQKILLVVRDSILEMAKKKFGIKKAILIKSADELPDK
jgi:nucleoside-triphosphatase THEP1